MLMNNILNSSIIKKITFILILIFPPLCLSIILKSSYYGDDAINSCTMGAIYSGEFESLFKLSMHYATAWIKTGRLYPVSFFYGYKLFSVLNTPITYKIFLIIITSINIYLFAFYIMYILNSKQFALLSIILYPICAPITFYYDNPYIAYHGIMQLIFMCSILAIIFTMSAFTSNHNKTIKFLKIIIACILYAIALLTYEPAYIFIFIFYLSMYCIQKNHFQALKSTSPLIITWCVCIALYLIIKILFKTDSYGGISVNIDFHKILTTYSKQFIASVPLISTLLLNHNISNLLANTLDLNNIFCVLLYIFLFYIILLNNKTTLCNFNHNATLILLYFLIAFCFMLLPPLLIALSQRYQNELQWGTAWLPVYIQSFGIILLMLIFIILKTKTRYTKLFLLIFTVIILFFNLTTAKISFLERESEHYYIYRSLIRNSVESGILFNYNIYKDILMPSSNYDFETNYDEIFFSNYAKKHIKVLHFNAITQKNVDLHLYNYKLITTNNSLNYVVFGKIKSTNFLNKYILLSECMLFVPQNNQMDNFYYVETLNSGQLKKNKLFLEKKLIKSNKYGNIYKLEPKQTIILNSMSTYDIQYPFSLYDTLNFATDNDIFFNLKNLDGLSGPEHWGRWSDANIAPTVKFQFNETLPDIFTLFLKANAFGPNIGDALTVNIADQTYSIQIPPKSPFDIKINVDLRGQKTNKIEFIPPKPTSPKELGLSDDGRKLGIGFISMKIIPIEGDKK